MVTKRDRVLIILLMGQAALDTAATSAHLTELAPSWTVAAVGLVSAMMSSATAVYVVATREPIYVPRRGIPDTNRPE